MYNQDFNINAPIIPAQSIGGIPQNIQIKELSQAIYNYENYNKEKSLMLELLDSLRYIQYNYLNGAIRLIVDVFSGKVTNIIAGKGYNGKFNNTIAIGSKVKDLLNLDPEFRCYATGGLMSPNYLGLCFYFTQNFDADVHDLTPYYENEIIGIGLLAEYDDTGNNIYESIYGESHPKFKS
jgi:hypothetical protein